MGDAGGPFYKTTFRNFSNKNCTKNEIKEINIFIDVLQMSWYLFFRKLFEVLSLQLLRALVRNA